MSRHEGELINRSTAPRLEATLPEQLAAGASFASCLLKSERVVALSALCYQACALICMFAVSTSALHICPVFPKLRLKSVCSQ